MALGGHLDPMTQVLRLCTRRGDAGFTSQHVVFEEHIDRDPPIKVGTPKLSDRAPSST